jgi:carboxylesterase type B
MVLPKILRSTCITALSILLCTAADPDGLQIALSAGGGTVLGTLPIPTVRQWLGIPYATAKRWQAPVAPPKLTVPFKADALGPSCPQSFQPPNVEFLRLAGLNDSEIFAPESEVCQSLNIWAPSVKRKQKTSVLGSWPIL